MPVVTPAEPHHVDAIAALANQMDRFYGAVDLEPPDRRAAQIADALFGTPPAAWALLAWRDEHLAGFAAYSYLWPAAGMSRSLYLKELYVATEHRRHGIGTLLMHHLLAVAADHACSRVEWTADGDNTPAQSFYDTLGFPRQNAKILYRVDLAGRVS